MDLKLKLNRLGSIRRLWINDKERDDCKILSLDIKITDTEKLVGIALNLDNKDWTTKELVETIIISKPDTKEGIEKIKQLGEELLKLSAEYENDKERTTERILEDEKRNT